MKPEMLTFLLIAGLLGVGYLFTQASSKANKQLLAMYEQERLAELNKSPFAKLFEGVGGVFQGFGLDTKDDNASDILFAIPKKTTWKSSSKRIR